ncbi:MAG: acyltransferase [Bacteroidales bacterium]|nr:acyltransferase [Bacteroidales bacterium]
MLGIEIENDKRIFGLDLLRCYAIYCVVLGHLRLLLVGTSWEGFPWMPSPRGVDIFFVLSGFLIGSSFIRYAEKNDGRVKWEKATAFWKKLCFRILPNYYLFLLLNFLFVKLLWINGDTNQCSIFNFITFTQNLFTPFYSFFWESWSLGVQMFFYLFFPLLLVGLTRWCPAKKSVLFISFFFIVISLIYRLILSNGHYDDFWWDVTFRKVTLSRIDCIYAGVLAAWIRFYHADLWNKYAVFSFILGVLLFFGIRQIPMVPNTLYTNVIFLSLSPIYIVCGLPLLDRYKTSKTKVGNVVTMISILSYGMYFINLLLVQLIRDNLMGMLSPILLYWLCQIAILVCAWLLYVLYEKRFMKLYQRIQQKKAKSVHSTL